MELRFKYKQGKRKQFHDRYCMCAASQLSSSQIGIIENNIGGKDNEFLSFISKRKGMRVVM